MKVLICGSRGWSDPLPIDLILAGLDVRSEGKTERLTVIHGGARGADQLAGRLARGWNADVIEEPADWEQHGKAAGPIRNSLMLEKYDPDVVIAFRSTGKSNGTDDMIRKAKLAGKPTYVITNAEEAS